jgi:tripeptide aminopeptidase
MKQKDLAEVLVKEMKEMGIEDAHLDEYGYVYGHIASRVDHDCPAVGFIAHMDTAPDYSGTGVNPRVIEKYDGKDIVLADGVVTRVSDYPYLEKCIGKRLIVTDGSTLLGGDDKAGVAAIMEACAYWMSHSEVKHGRISIAFTPDEEIGRGTDHFNLDEFGADFAYTMDGGSVAGWCDETFNAASAKLSFHGVSIHPGSAKDRMVNALNLAIDFHNALPRYMRPEHTSGRQPFFHLIRMEGTGDQAESAYIVRAHEKNDFAAMKRLMEDTAARMNELIGYQAVELKITDSYYNMHDVLKDHPEVASIAEKAIASLGIEPVHESVRGGTDGAMLTYKGLPCPNLGTGDQNCHGRYEYVVVEEMDLAAKLIIRIGEMSTEVRK